MYRKVNGFDGANLEEDGDPRQWEQVPYYNKQVLANQGIVTTKYAQNTNMTYQYESPLVEKMNENIPVKRY